MNYETVAGDFIPLSFEIKLFARFSNTAILPQWAFAMEQRNLIESDPVVFTEIFQRLGVKNVKVEELFSLEPEGLLEFQRSGSQVNGLIFLFKWDSSISSDGIPIDSRDSKWDEEDESFHFVCYVPHQSESGQVLEIDGLQQSALLHFPASQDSGQVPWTTTAL